MRVLVVGDVMLDRYWFGDVERVSPEAPVPVVHVKRVDDRAGGAANVALNARALGADVRLTSIIGRDDSGAKLRDLCLGLTTYFVKGEVPTTLKMRIVGRSQQLVRADFEEEPDGVALEELLVAYREDVERVDRVVFSDYGKGALLDVKTMISLALGFGKEVYVDPKGSDYSRYRGVHLIKPNQYELRDAVGAWKSEHELASKVLTLRMDLGIDQVLLTQAQDGMTLFDSEGAHHVPSVVQEVFDVTGAGDTAIAAIAATEGDMMERVFMANKAAGSVCRHFGTTVVKKSELL